MLSCVQWHEVFLPSTSCVKLCTHTNPFNPSLDSYVCRGARSSMDYPVADNPGAPVIRDASSASMRGGLKGKTAPGDAHPYLALFYLKKLL